MPRITVKQGDSLSSMEEKFGLPWEKIWNHSENSELKEKRKDPNVLMPGDRIFIPDKELKEESCSDGSRHSFRLLRERPTLQLCLRVRLPNGEEETIADEDYELQFDQGDTKTGRTDDDGNLQADIPARARSARVVVPGRNLVIPVNLGKVDPIDEPTGIQARLNMLGYQCGDVDGKIGPVTRETIKRFQKNHGLTVDGIAGPQTQNKLKEVFGS